MPLLLILCADRIFHKFVKEIAANFAEPHKTRVIGRHELDAAAAQQQS